MTLKTHKKGVNSHELNKLQLNNYKYNIVLFVVLLSYDQCSLMNTSTALEEDCIPSAPYLPPQQVIAT